MVELLTARFDVAWIVWAARKLQFTFTGAYAQPLTVAHFVEVIEAQMEKQTTDAVRARVRRDVDAGFDDEGRMHSNEAAMGKLLYGGSK